MRCRVMKIKPGMIEYESSASSVWPWMVLEVDRDTRVQTFRTHRQALHFAVTGEVLNLSTRELWELNRQRKLDTRARRRAR